jgi:hypothetical protein
MCIEIVNSPGRYWFTRPSFCFKIILRLFKQKRIGEFSVYI